MFNKINYKLGDIFKIPLVNRYYGLGRILIIDSPAIFVEFYGKVIFNEEIQISTLKNEKYLIRIICGDLGFKRNEWIVIGNIPIEKHLRLPYFWDKNGLTGKLYLREYLYNEKHPLRLINFEDKPTTEKEIEDKDAQPDGLFGWKAAEIKLKVELEKARVL